MDGVRHYSMLVLSLMVIARGIILASTAPVDLKATAVVPAIAGALKERNSAAVIHIVHLQ